MAGSPRAAPSRGRTLPWLLAAASWLVPAAALAEPAARPDAQCAQAGTSEANQRFAEVQDMRLAYVRCGEGAPTIVFEMGFGGNLEPWQRVFPHVAEFAPAFAYSRPNRGRSEGSWAADEDGMRTSEEAARLLRETLAAAGVPPPYILVGASLGGLYIQKFAQLFPGDTAGIVLVDNRPATFMRECTAARIPQCLGAAVDPSWSASIRSTYLGIEPSEQVAPTPEQLGDIPVLVITATRTEMENADAFLSGIRGAQTRFAAGLRRGRQYLAEGASHDSLIGDDAGQTVEQIRIFWGEVSEPR